MEAGQGRSFESSTTIGMDGRSGVVSQVLDVHERVFHKGVLMYPRANPY